MKNRHYIVSNGCCTNVQLWLGARTQHHLGRRGPIELRFCLKKRMGPDGLGVRGLGLGPDNHAPLPGPTYDPSDGRPVSCRQPCQWPATRHVRGVP